MYSTKSDTSVVKDTVEIHFPEDKVRRDADLKGDGNFLQNQSILLKALPLMQADFVRTALSLFPVEGKISGSQCKASRFHSPLADSRATVSAALMT